MSASYELVNWILLGVAALLGLAMGLNHLALLEARKRNRNRQSDEPDPFGAHVTLADRVKITINASGAGWADYVLVIGSQTFSMDGVSYCSDALGDLLRAALQLAAGGREANCAFDREPYEWRLSLQSDVDPGRLFLRVSEFPDFQKQSPTDTGEVCFRAECGMRDFTLAVEHAAVALLNEKGDAGYRDWWGMPFPGAALRALQAAHASR